MMRAAVRWFSEFDPPAVAGILVHLNGAGWPRVPNLSLAITLVGVVYSSQRTIDRRPYIFRPREET